MKYDPILVNECIKEFLKGSENKRSICGRPYECYYPEISAINYEYDDRDNFDDITYGFEAFWDMSEKFDRKLLTVEVIEERLKVFSNKYTKYQLVFEYDPFIPCDGVHCDQPVDGHGHPGISKGLPIKIFNDSNDIYFDKIKDVIPEELLNSNNFEEILLCYDMYHTNGDNDLHRGLFIANLKTRLIKLGLNI